MGSVTALFPLWAVLCSLWAYTCPGVFVPLKDAIVPLLGIIMFGMGITLRADDFVEIVRRPALVAVGVALQFGLMPFFAWAVGHALRLPRELLIGLVVVGSCPGGTASNVISYLAKADVPLSITLTSCSTTLAFLATPALTWAYIGHTVHVPFMEMMLSVVKIIVIPVLAGIAANTLWGKRIKAVIPYGPLFSMVAIVLVIAIIFALNRPQIATAGRLVIVAVILLNGLGLLGGYVGAKLFRFGEPQARTVAIEVGMQNSGLGVALSMAHFSALAALPSALFSVWHNLSGSLLASYWSRQRTAH